MTPEEELLVEQVVTARRRRRGDGSIASSPAWHDLDEAGRLVAFDETARQRRLEAALDSDGFSSTVRALLGRLEGAE